VEVCRSKVIFYYLCSQNNNNENEI
jgi:hypothetical protein